MNKIHHNTQQAIQQLGAKLRAAREASKRSQEDVASAAALSRSTLVHIEAGKSANTTKIMAVAAALGVEISIADPVWAQANRRILRLQQDAKVREALLGHLRLAVSFLSDAAAGKSLLADARNTVRLWRENKTCSLFYIESWENLLRGSVKDVGRSLGTIDPRWSNALLQNTPFAHALLPRRASPNP